METYFTIKLWLEYYLPLIVLAGCALLIAFVWILSKINKIGEKIINKHYDEKDCDK